jgi:type II secretory pathway component PulM
MKSAFDQLNLKPQERRFVVIGGIILFLLLNFWLVWPHYGDLGRVRRQILQANATLDKYREEFARTNEYVAQLQVLEKQGSRVLDRDADLVLLSTVQRLARESGILAPQVTPGRVSTAKPDEFFEQQQLTLGMGPTPPDAVVSFLVALTTNDLVIRVKELDLRPDQTVSKLQGTIRVVANLQKKALTAQSGSAPAKPSAPPKSS